MTRLEGTSLRRLLGRLLLVSGLISIGSTPLAAQASLLAHLTVLQPVVTGAGIRPVEFGVVTPGTAVSVTIATAADSAAEGTGSFRFTGVTGARSAQLDFAWGANLVNGTDGMTIPLSMNGSYGLYCWDRKIPLPVCQTFTPGAEGATTGSIVATPPAPPGGNTGSLRVYLGGAIMPPASLSPGLYTTTISVTLTRL